jgi:hypothetical protein
MELAHHKCLETVIKLHYIYKISAILNKKEYQTIMTLYDFFLKLTRPVGFLVFAYIQYEQKEEKSWKKMKKKFSAPIFFFFFIYRENAM